MQWRSQTGKTKALTMASKQQVKPKEDLHGKLSPAAGILNRVCQVGGIFLPEVLVVFQQNAFQDLSDSGHACGL